MENLSIQKYFLGLQPYNMILDLQRRLRQEVAEGVRGNTLLILRHPPTFTLGRSASRQNILVSDKQLKEEEIGVYQIERGGDVTYHGPGQLMAYPIWKLTKSDKDIRRLVFNLEEVCLRLLETYGVCAIRREGFPGLWLGTSNETASNQTHYKPRKVASIGLAIKQWVTFHGIALNIREEGQQPFEYINPCGLTGIQVTSLQKETGKIPGWPEIEKTFLKLFSDITGLEICESSEELL